MSIFNLGKDKPTAIVASTINPNSMPVVDFAMSEFKGQYRGFKMTIKNNGRFQVEGNIPGLEVTVQSPQFYWPIGTSSDQLMMKAFQEAVSTIDKLLQ